MAQLQTVFATAYDIQASGGQLYHFQVTSQGHATDQLNTYLIDFCTLSLQFGKHAVNILVIK